MGSGSSSAQIDVPQEGDPNFVGPLPSSDSPSTGGASPDSRSGQTALGIAGSVATGASGGSLLGPVGSVVGAVVGAGVGIYGAITSAQDQAQIDQEKAALEGAQADEVARREAANDALSQQTAFREKADISAEMAGSGHAGGSIGSQLEIQRQTNQQIQLNDEAAAFQESQIRAGASMESQLGAETSLSGYVRAAGYGVTALSQSGVAISRYGVGAAQPLPQIGSAYA